MTNTRDQPAHDRNLDGVIIPIYVRPDTMYDSWYQTSNATPFLYLPPIEASFDDGVPHMSRDVLVAVSVAGGDRFFLVGWFSFYSYQWQYYGVDPTRFDEFTPHFWSHLPDDDRVPLGWRSSERNADDNNEGGSQ